MKVEVPIHCAHDEVLELTKIYPNINNPNKHPEKQIELLAEIIKKTGWRAPITISNRSGNIVRGHGRLDAAKKAGLTHAPVDYQDYENEQEEWADLIADNKISELSEWNFKELTEIIGDIDTGDFDMKMTGFDEKSLEDLMTWSPNSENEDNKTSNNDDNTGINGDIEEQYKIVIECDNEEHQVELLQKFIEDGLKCQALML